MGAPAPNTKLGEGVLQLTLGLEWCWGLGCGGAGAPAPNTGQRVRRLLHLTGPRVGWRLQYLAQAWGRGREVCTLHKPWGGAGASAPSKRPKMGLGSSVPSSRPGRLLHQGRQELGWGGVFCAQHKAQDGVGVFCT